MILFIKLKDLHGQVMVKNEIDNIISVSKIISDQITCVNLNVYVGVLPVPPGAETCICSLV